VSLVFLDTVGLLATWDKSDQWHVQAATALEQVQNSGAVTVTTTFVLLECGNAASRRPYRSAVDRLRQALDSAGCLLRPSAEEWDEGWRAYVRGDGAGGGIVDQVSFLVMRRLGIRQAFTNDRHFVAAGFETLF
jgi:predicted nucleic acid-binding protein